MENEVNWNKLLDCALGIAARFLAYGAEISRVEDTVIQICKSYGVDSVDVFAIPSKVEATIEIGDEYYTTKIRRIYDSEINLGKIEELNQISRDICTNLPNVSDIYEIIKEFDKPKKNKLFYLEYIAVFIGCFSFAVMYGGTIRDGISAGVIALLMSITSLFINKFAKYKLFNTLVLSVLGGFLSVLLYYIHLGEHISYIMIGAIMLLIPGKEFGIAFRELLMRDIISGAIRMFQAITIALVIVIGFSIPIAIFNYDMDFYKFHNDYITVVFATLGCSAFALIFNSKLKRLPFIAVGSFIVITTYLILRNYDNSILISTFVAQIVGALYSEIVARIIKSPTIITLITTNLSLVPGGLLYYTVYALYNNKVGAKAYFTDVLYSSIGIGAGILFVSVFANAINRYKNRNN